jgi:hypothetical protein
MALACRRQPGHRPQHGAEVAGACPAHHDGDIRERRGGGGAEHRSPDVVSGSGPDKRVPFCAIVPVERNCYHRANSSPIATMGKLYAG